MLQRIVMVSSGLALLCMGAGVVLTVNIARYGALNTRPGGASAQDNIMAIVLSAAGLIGLLLLVGSAGICVALALQRKQWPWAGALVLLTVGGLYAYGTAGFTADVLSGLVSLSAPLACLFFAAWSHPVVRQPVQAS